MKGDWRVVMYAVMLFFVSGGFLVSGLFSLLFLFLFFCLKKGFGYDEGS